MIAYVFFTIGIEAFDGHPMLLPYGEGQPISSPPINMNPHTDVIENNAPSDFVSVNGSNDSAVVPNTESAIAPESQTDIEISEESNIVCLSYN